MYLQMLLGRMYLQIWCIYKCFYNKRMQKRFGYFWTFLIWPFTNAKLKCVFSWMNGIKTDRRSSLSRDCLDVLFRISEDGPSLEEFNPDASIDCWYSVKVRRLNTGHHNEPSKRKKSSDDKCTTELEMLTFYDLENNESYGDVDFDWKTELLLMLFVLLLHLF